MALPYNQVTAITHDLIKDKMTEGVFNSAAFTKRLREKQVVEEGGSRIICPLMAKDDTGSNGQFYARGDSLNLTEVDTISASVHDWKLLEETVVVYKIDIAKNAGKYGVLKLVGSRVKQAEMAMGQRFVKGALSDGTAGTGALDADQYVGLDAIIAAAGTYGSIAPADLATWVSYVNDNGAVGRALTKELLDLGYDQAAEFGIGAPTCAILNKSVFGKMKALLDPAQRTTRDSSLGGLGHKGQSVVYNGIDYIIENNMPDTAGGDGQIFYVDEEHFKFHVHKDNNMRRQSESSLETEDALLERIFLYGEVIASERKFHSRVTDILQ